MAAILCSSIGSCCASVGSCLTFPCTACGACCSSICSSIGRALTSPFTPYLVTTVVLNTPPAVWGLRTGIEVFQFGHKCNGSSWLLVNALLSLLHVLAAFYIAHRIQHETSTEQLLDISSLPSEGSSPANPIDPEGATSAPYKPMDSSSVNGSSKEASPLWRIATSIVFPGPAKASQMAKAMAAQEHGEEGKANSWQRLKQVLCYDVTVALYIIAVLVWLVWQSVGISQVLFGHEDSDDYRCENIEKRTVLSIFCGFLYIMLVFVTFACSFLFLK